MSNLHGKVTDETLLGVLPFIEDPASEVEKLQEQKKQAVEEQRELFSNTPLNRDDVDEAE